MARARSESNLFTKQAAEWLVGLSSEDPGERARSQQEFDRWKAADPQHAQAAARMETFLGQVQSVRQSAAGNTRPAHAALDAALAGVQSHKRAIRYRATGSLLAVLAVLAVAVSLFFMASSGSPADLIADLQADVRSDESSWVSRTLPDGSRITLSGRAAIDLRFDEHHRTVKLLHGDIRVEVAKDTSRPFDVETSVARIRALGTRFAVSHQNDRTRLQMFESKVAVQALTEPGAPLIVQAGEHLVLTRQGADSIEHLDAERVEQGWQRHQLVLNDRPLPEALAQLAQHRPGGIRFDANELQGLRVSAVLPLDKPDDALQLLLTSLPELRQRTFAGRWVWISLAADDTKK